MTEEPKTPAQKAINPKGNKNKTVGNLMIVWGVISIPIVSYGGLIFAVGGALGSNPMPFFLGLIAPLILLLTVIIVGIRLRKIDIHKWHYFLFSISVGFTFYSWSWASLNAFFFTLLVPPILITAVVIAGIKIGKIDIRKWHFFLFILFIAFSMWPTWLLYVLFEG